jgi:hypothetical protein
MLGRLPLPDVPANWGDTLSRLAFFDALPQPLIVLLACDLASLPRQTPLGHWTIEQSRRWLVDQASEQDLLAAWELVSDILDSPGRRTVLTPLCAARYTLDTVLQDFAADYAVAAATAAALGADPEEDPRPYARQRALVADIMQCVQSHTARQLLEVARRDSAVRPLLWDALHDAGYTPVATKLE